MREYSKDELLKIYEKYMSMHGEEYTKQQYNFFKENFGKDQNEHFAQIYHTMGMLNEDEDPFIAFADLIEKTYGLDINIVEVSAGVCPSIGEEISKRQQRIGKGTITVYDPLLSRNLDLKHIVLKKERFSYGTDISKCDLLISKEPCGATFDVIDASADHKKDLIISPCDCYCMLPEDIEYDSNPKQQWYDYIKYILECDYSKRKPTIETYHLDEKYNYENPIYDKCYSKTK